MELSISYWTVLAAALVNMIIGSIWYSPILFGNAWLRAMGKRKEDIKGGGKAMAAMIIPALITAYVLAHFLQVADATTVSAGMIIAFWAWLGFSFTTAITGPIFEQKSWKVFWIGTFYNLVAFLVMSWVLATNW